MIIKKKFIYGSFFLLTIGVAVMSCKKEQNKSISLSDTKMEYRLDKIPVVKYNGNLEIAMKSETDADEEKLNNQLFQLAEATKELIKNQTFNALIVNLAKESNVDVAYYSDIQTYAPVFYNQINAKLALNNLSTESITSQMTHQPTTPNPEHPETGSLEIYQPAILVPNSSKANTNLQALISPNVESFYEEQDCILAWFFDVNGVQSQTILNETTATLSTNPIFIVDHAIPKIKMDKIGAFFKDAKKGTIPPKGDHHFETTKIQIKNGYRYESLPGNKSEFCISGIIIRNDNTPINFLHLDNSKDQSMKIKEITKSQI